jgi:hypothetical protein
MFEPKATAPHLDSTATTFIITHSPSRSDHRGGLNFLRARGQPRGRPRPNIDFLVRLRGLNSRPSVLQNYRSMAGCEYSQVFNGTRTCSGRCRRAGRRSPSGTVGGQLALKWGIIFSTGFYGHSEGMLRIGDTAGESRRQQLHRSGRTARLWRREILLDHPERSISTAIASQQPSTGRALDCIWH